jgi:carboxymethylenebutenolidase
MSTIKLTAADGHTFSAYRAGAEGATMGLVVVQEIFGVNSHMRFASDALAQSGFAVVTPALFDRAERDVELGYTPEDIQTGLALRAKITGGIAATKTETPHCPVQLHFGAEDHGIPLSDVDAIRAAQPGVEVYVYEGAGHGFGCEQRASFDQKSFDLAQNRSLDFFRKHLA